MCSNNWLFSRLFFLFLFAGFSNVNAATVALFPSEQEILPGQSVTVEISLDFTGEPTVGGGFDIVFDNFTNDSGLTFLSYQPTDLGDPAFRRSPDVLSGRLAGFSVGDFNGIEGLSLMGTLTFLGEAPGLYTLGFSRNAVIDPFTGVNGNLSVVNYSGTSISVVPIPGAFGFLALGLGLMGLICRRT